MLRTLSRPLVAFVVAATPALAADTFVVDPNHSEASFRIRHLVSNVSGRFNDVAGTIQIDRENPEASSVQFTIQAASIDTANENRDQHLRSEDFFHVEAHPEITFESTRVEKKSDELFHVTGNLTMRGVTKEITLPVTFLGFGPGMRGGELAGFETETTLDRKDFGIVWNRALDQGGVVLGDEVKVRIALETAHKKQEPAAASN